MVRLSENPDGVFGWLSLNPATHLFTIARNAESLARLEELALAAGRAQSTRTGTSDLVNTDSVWLHPDSAMPRFDRLAGEVEADVVVLGGGLVGHHHRADAPGGRPRRGARGGRPARRGCVRPHHRQSLVPARPQVRVAALEVRRRGGAHLRAGQPGGPGVDGRPGQARTPSTATSAAGRRSPTCRPESPPSDVENEAEAAAEAGLPRLVDDSAPLPYPIAAAVRFDDQAEFHVRKYLGALVEQFIAAGGRAFERSARVPGRLRDPCVVRVPGGMVKAAKVVVATHYPFLDRSLAFARVHRPALLRRAVPRQEATARGHVPGARRLRGRSAPCRSTARSSCWSAARATRPAPAATRASAMTRCAGSPTSTGASSPWSTSGPRRTTAASTSYR